MSGEPTLHDVLEEAVEFEMRAMLSYGHMAVYCRGMYRLTLAPLFEAEAAESAVHLSLVRGILSDLQVEPGTKIEIDLDLEETMLSAPEDLLMKAFEMERTALSIYRHAHVLAEGRPIIQRQLETLIDQEDASVAEISRLLR